MEFSLFGTVLTLGGQPVTGFGKSDAISWKDTVPERRKVVPCCDGGEVVVRTHNESADLTITLRHGSPANRSLAALDGGAASFTVALEIPMPGAGGSLTATGAVCCVTKRPEPKYGDDPADWTWEIHCAPWHVQVPAGGV